LKLQISFLNLEAWKADLLSAEPGVTVAVIGNKSDLRDDRKVEVRVICQFYHTAYISVEV
jgi:GTPase SAR1 family protein